MLVGQVRKRRSAAEKRLIVEQALAPGASVARVARAHGLNANVVFNWRQLYREGKLRALPEHSMKLLPVSVAEHDVVEHDVAEHDVAEQKLDAGVSARYGSIHIELPGEVRISVEGDADPAAIRAVLESLRA